MPASQKLQPLIDRLRSFGLELSLERDSDCTVGELPLSPTAFTTLERSLVFERARFYVFGPLHLKFFQPRVLFDLPPVNVAGCASAADVESALRRAWFVVQRDLSAARDRFVARGILVSSAVQGTRLQMPVSDEGGVLAEIRSPKAILLPSCGALADVSPESARARVFRPPDGVDQSELEIAVSDEITRVGRAARRAASVVEAPRVTVAEALEHKHEHRVLVVAHPGSLRDQLIARLPRREMAPDIPRDPTRALEAFRRHSYELVLIEAQMPRVDGFELAARMKSVPGIDRLPVVLLEERARDASRRAAEAAGASVYLPGPFAWGDMIATFGDMLDHTSQRRFSRFSARMLVRTAGRGMVWDDLTETVARGGLTLRTRREVQLGSAETYRITLPQPLGTIDVVGLVVSRITLPGFASVLAGVRLLSFAADGEARWIRTIESLAARQTEGR